MSLLHAMQLPNPNKPHSSVGWATALHVRGLQVKPSRSHWNLSSMKKFEHSTIKKPTDWFLFEGNIGCQWFE